MSALAVTLISAGAALGASIVTASVNSWLTTRAKVGEELRDQRLKIYPGIWERTKLFSRWPRTEATYEDLRRLHRHLREWYYETGGLYMSENCRARYGEMQELFAAQLSDGPAPTARIGPTEYDDLMEICSAFRTALNEDLESRRQGSLLWSVRKGLLHRRQKRAAKQRVAAAASRRGAAASGGRRAFDPQLPVSETSSSRK